MTMTSPLNTTLAVVLISAMAVPAARAQAPLEDTPIPMWVPDAPSRDVVRVGNTLVVGGSFEYVGPPTGTFAVVDAADPTNFTTGANLAGATTHVVSDGAGGWVAVVDDCACGAAGRLEHILASGLRDPHFASALGSVTVNALAVDAGRLFVAAFTPAGQERLFALDPVSGAVLPWTPATQPRQISSLVADSGVVYVNYARISGLSNSLALDGGTGAVVPFPVLQDAEVIAAAAGRVYVVTPAPGTKILSAYAANGQKVPTFPDLVYNSLGTVVASSTRLYVVGAMPGGLIRAEIVARDVDTAGVVWTSPVFSFLNFRYVDGGIGALAVDGNTLFAGGIFTRVGGAKRTRLAAFDTTSGALLPWAPSVGGFVVATVQSSAGRVAFGGTFRSVGGMEKRGLVSLDLATGRPTAVQPPDSNYVTALAARGDLVVAATANQPLNAAPEIFAYSAATGIRYPKALALDNFVSSMTIDGNTLFMGGRFTSIDGQPRRNLAAYDLAAGQVRAWNPSPDDLVIKVKVHDGQLYAVGLFKSVTGAGRNGAVAFDLGSLNVNGWDPHLTGLSVADLDAWRDRIFLSVLVRNEFQQLPPFSVVRTVAVDRFSGAVLNIDLPLGTDVAQVGGTLVISGDGTSLGNPVLPLALSTLDGTTGQSLPWSPTIAARNYGEIIGIDGYLVVVGARAVGGLPLGGGLAVFKQRIVLPGAPRRIQMTVTGSTVALAWSPGAAPAPLGYVLEAGSEPGLSDLGRFPVGLATQVAAGVAPGSYALRVRAIGASGEGPPSSEWLFTTPSTSAPPGAPSALVGAVAGTVVTLGWNAAAGNATTYVVEAGTAPGLSNLGVLPLGSLDTSVAGAVPAGTYYFRMRAANAFGSSAPSNEIVLVVP